MTAVATTQREKAGIAALVEYHKDRIAPYLRDGITLEQIQQEAWLAAQKNPAIIKCSQSSIIAAIVQILDWGLVVGQTAHIVPFGDVATPIADYKGLIELMVGSGAVRAVEAHAVYSGDEFRYNYGLDKALYHVPAPAKTRGALSHAYTIVRITSYLSDFLVMPIEDIDAIRTRYSKQWKTGACPPWYAKKTTVRQIAKMIPKDRRLAKVLRVIDQDREQELGEMEIQTPAQQIEDGELGAPAPYQLSDGSRTLDDIHGDATADGELPLGVEAERKPVNAVREGR